MFIIIIIIITIIITILLLLSLFLLLLLGTHHVYSLKLLNNSNFKLILLSKVQIHNGSPNVYEQEKHVYKVLRYAAYKCPQVSQLRKKKKKICLPKRLVISPPVRNV